MAEASAGKDSVTGHWEMMGIVLDRAFPTFPDGFPPEIIAEFSRLTGRGVLGNKAASGTAIIDELGPEHMRTGALIVYTSADSVFQIAAHEDDRADSRAVSRLRDRLHAGRRGARRRPRDRAAVRRRAGPLHADRRTATTTRCRRPARRCSIALKAASIPVVAIGKIEDLFAGRGITARHPHRQRRRRHGPGRAADGERRSRLDLREPRRLRHAVRPPQRRRRLRAQPRALRRPAGGAAARSCETTICSSSPPTTATIRRRRAPITRASTCRCSSPAPRVRAGGDLGTRETFADLGQTLAELFGVGPLAHGTSFLQEITMIAYEPRSRTQVICLRFADLR